MTVIFFSQKKRDSHPKGRSKSNLTQIGPFIFTLLYRLGPLARPTRAGRRATCKKSYHAGAFLQKARKIKISHAVTQETNPRFPSSCIAGRGHHRNPSLPPPCHSPVPFRRGVSSLPIPPPLSPPPSPTPARISAPAAAPIAEDEDAGRREEAAWIRSRECRTHPHLAQPPRVSRRLARLCCVTALLSC